MTQWRINQNGYSLLEVMIVASLMLIVSLGAAQFITNQGKQISAMEDRLSRIQLSQELMSLFNQRHLCLKMLSTIQIAKNDEPIPIKIENDLGTVYFDPQNPNNSYDHLKVKSAYVVNRSVKAVNKIGEVEIQVGVSRLRDSGNQLQLNPINFNVEVVIDSNSVVKSCYPKRTRICADSVILRAGQIPNPVKDFRNCCTGGGALSDCVTTGLNNSSAGNSIFYICTCD